VYLLVTKAILSSVIGSSFYKWWEDTKMGVWFQDKLDATLDKLDWDMLEKEDKWKKAYPNLALRLEGLEDRVLLLEGALDNLIPERRQGAD
jgi:hypothetical protein